MIVMRYQATHETVEKIAKIRLTDSVSESVAEIIPEMGNNLLLFMSEGCPIIEPPKCLPVFKRDSALAFAYGIPLLFPPNRVKNGRFSYQGREYALPLNEPPDNHLHGEIGSKAWEMIEYGASDDQGAYATSCFRYADHPDLMAYFPHSLVFTVTYRLIGGRLYMSGSIVNEGGDEAPFAFGLHPYFSLPHDSGEDIVFKVPAKEEWPVTRQAFVMGPPSVTPFSEMLNEGVSIREYPKQGCSLLSLNEENSTCSIELMGRGYTIYYRFSSLFSHMVLFRPDWSSSFSLEPYTCVTDAFNLPYDGKITGARGIDAGETVAFETSIWTERT